MTTKQVTDGKVCDTETLFRHANGEGLRALTKAEALEWIEEHDGDGELISRFYVAKADLSDL